MSKKHIIEYFEKVESEDPSDKIIKQIRDLIHEGVLKPGDKLPSEKMLEEKTGIGRGYISRALRSLETYGILKTVPQSGSYVAAIGIRALESLASNILKLDNKNLEALMDVKYVLERYVAELIVNTITDENIKELNEINKELSNKISNGNVNFDDDMVFHLKIADLTSNPVLRSLLTLVTSQAITLFKEMEKKLDKENLLDRLKMAVEEHNLIIQALSEHDNEKIQKLLLMHYEEAKKFRLNLS